MKCEHLSETRVCAAAACQKRQPRRELLHRSGGLSLSLHMEGGVYWERLRPMAEGIYCKRWERLTCSETSVGCKEMGDFISHTPPPPPGNKMDPGKKKVMCGKCETPELIKRDGSSKQRIGSLRSRARFPNAAASHQLI